MFENKVIAKFIIFFGGECETSHIVSIVTWENQCQKSIDISFFGKTARDRQRCVYHIISTYCVS